MIQKFTCVPKSDYDVIVVSNGTINQIESKLIEINQHSNNTIPLNSKITYLDNFNSLVHHLYEKNIKSFPGKIVFMFFNGLEYIQDLIGDLIDHYSKCFLLANFSDSESMKQLENVYLYFDTSILMANTSTSSYVYSNQEDYDIQLDTIATFANDVVKKMHFIIGKIRGVYIDDIKLDGNGFKYYKSPDKKKTCQVAGNVDMSCFSQLIMSDMIL